MKEMLFINLLLFIVMSKTKVYTRYMFLFLLLLASSVGAMATADRVVMTSGRVVKVK